MHDYTVVSKTVNDTLKLLLYYHPLRRIPLAIPAAAGGRWAKGAPHLGSHLSRRRPFLALVYCSFNSSFKKCLVSNMQNPYEWFWTAA